MKKEDFHVGDKFIFPTIGTKKDSTWIITDINDDYVFYKYYSGEAENFNKSKEFVSSWINFLINDNFVMFIKVKGKIEELRVAIDKIKSIL